MNRHKFKFISLATLFLGVSMSVNGATIVYDFNGDNTGFVLNPAPAVLTSSVSSNDFGSGVTASNYTFSNTSTSGDREIAIVDGVTKAKHSGVNQTHVFTVTIADTVTVDLTGLSFDFGVNYEPGSWTLGLSQGSANKLSESYAGSGNPTFADQSESLTLSGLTGLTDTSVTFTIIDTTPGNNSGESFFSYFDNVTIIGTAIPEPTSSALLALGFGSLIMRRRR